MQIGQKIRSVRELRGFSQEYLGKKLGVTQQYYSKVEAGKTDFDDVLLERIAAVLEVNKELLQSFDTNLVFNNNYQQGGNFNAGHTIQNNFPEALIDQMIKMKVALDDILNILSEKDKREG